MRVSRKETSRQMAAESSSPITPPTKPFFWTLGDEGAVAGLAVPMVSTEPALTKMCIRDSC